MRVSTITIASGSSYDLTTLLATGENIEFLSNPASSGTLTIDTAAFESDSITGSGTSLISAGLGGPVEGFKTGDTIIMRDLAADDAIFGQSPGAAEQNFVVSYALGVVTSNAADNGSAEVITVSAAGEVTGNTGLLEELPAALVSELDTYVTALDQGLFPDGAQTGSLYITLAQSHVASDVDATDGAVVACCLRGTRILTQTGERMVESLKPGDLVISHSGGVRPVKWIGEQTFGARFVANNRERLPVKIAAGALAENLPLRDLYVSPGHSLLLGGQLVLARDLVNGVTITQPARSEDTYYYLIELDTHDCVIADGVWAETYADAPGLRNQFHNAADFHARFPGHLPPETMRLYAPHPDSAPALAASLRPVLERADITPGPLRGYVDAIGDRIEGWALDEAHPNFPVLVEIFAGNTRLGAVLACDYREDLAKAGMGSGRCMFSLPLPAGLPPSVRAQLRAERAADGAELPLTPGCSAAARRAA